MSDSKRPSRKKRVPGGYFGQREMSLPGLEEDWADAIAEMPVDGISRRRFLSLLSASAALAFGSSCTKIDRGTIVPYTRRPGDIIPGVADYYASTFQEGLVTHGVLVKTREGRPIHIEGNTDHVVSRGKTGLRALADLLGLYDPDRLRAPLFKGKPSTWEEVEKAMAHSLEEARRTDKSVLLFTGAIVSPTQAALIDDLKRALPTLQHAAWEPVAPQAETQAAQELYGEARIPRLHLSRADVVLSLQADFLGNDSSAPVFIQDFAARRAIAKATDSMNRLWVIEGNMTLTGTNADHRLQLRPLRIARLVFVLARLLNELHSVPLPSGLSVADLKAFEPEQQAKALGIELSMLKLLASDLARAGKSALVLAGPSLPPEAHTACSLLNAMLGADGNTVESSAPPMTSKLLSFAELQAILEDADRGKFAVGIFWNTNPAYAFPTRSQWQSAIGKIPNTYRIGLYEDETAIDCTWRLPEHHWLEGWGDFESAAGFISLRQPTIGAVHDSRQAEDIILSCMRRMNLQVPRNYLEYIKSRWRSSVFPSGSPVPFETFWNAALHDGGVKRESVPQPQPAMKTEAVRKAISVAAKTGSDETPSGLELVLFPGAGVYDGRYANNGWLNELPDPVTKATWENPVLLSGDDAKRLGFGDGDVVEITTGIGSVEASVNVQPGQAPGVAGLALGYGRRTGNVAAGVGANAYALIDVASASPYLIARASISRKNNKARRPIPKTQVHDRMEGRDLARSWTLSEYSRKVEKETKSISGSHASLVPEQKFPDHKWSMAVDLSACVGCGACVIACQSENNIPVVGPERILVNRWMHWIRVDRYYEGDPRNPSIIHQPVLCQHCNNAPCEIVCPVNATTHSPDGLNQMAYNRCVGTRYCSNNCPFKVRRFNFFDYTSMKKEPESLVFNPEVTVRPRGVMEKCTFCIQRIQNAKQNAKIEGRQIMDGEIQPACAVACPAGALVFGDLNDAQSRVSKMAKMDRSYRMLEELGVKPSVVYLADISNPAAGKGEA